MKVAKDGEYRRNRRKSTSRKRKMGERKDWNDARPVSLIIYKLEHLRKGPLFMYIPTYVYVNTYKKTNGDPLSCIMVW